MIDIDPLAERGDDDGPEPPPEIRALLIAAAERSIAREQAALERVAGLTPRRRKKEKRRVFFEALRDGSSRAAACDAAGITAAEYALWTSRPQFVDAIERAELSASRPLDDWRL